MKNIRSLFWHTCLVGMTLLMGWGTPAVTEAQQSTATINSSDGDVLVSLQGETPTPGIPGTVLRSGDTVWTYAGAKAMLNLADGSRIELGEQTNARLSSLAEYPQSGARRPRVNILWGRLRAILSPAYQTAGSSFTVQTPNALISVTSSEVDTEVSYEPMTQTTIVFAHEFDVNIINLTTGVTLHIPQGHSAIVRDGVIQEISNILARPTESAVQQQTAMLSGLTGEVLVSLQNTSVTPAVEGIVVRAGDTIRTNAGAVATLTFSDGTVLQLGENTHINLYTLTEDAQTNLRTSRLELYRGQLLATLGTGYQVEGASFTVQTSNVQAVMKHGEDVNAEMLYDPNTSVTTLIAHKAPLMITHLKTEVSTSIPEGHSGIIYDHVIQEVARILPSPSQSPAPATSETEAAQEDTQQPSEETAPQQ